MTRSRARQRTRACGRPEARKRLADARKYLEVAELVAGEDGRDSQALVTFAEGTTQR